MSIWGAMHGYVFWRLATVPGVAGNLPHAALATAAVVLWLSYLIGRTLDSHGHRTLARIMEPATTAWIGLLFIWFSLLLMVDVVTLGGYLLPEIAPILRGGATLLGLSMACVGTVAALLPPTVRQTDVPLPGLPANLDGTTLVLISDLHLGSLLGVRWLNRLVAQINELKPDFVVVAGDVADHDFSRVAALLPSLRKLRAPHGVWAVTGNHDAYAGLSRMQNLLRSAGFNVLNDTAVEVLPGLKLAGVDDLSVPRPETEDPTDAIDNVLDQTSGSAAILLSHTPDGIERAIQNGAGLMLSGHTHGGQIWPFNFLVRTRYKYVGGRYDLGRMTLIVCRGTGTWGPRMRIWKPSELWKIHLRTV